MPFSRERKPFWVLTVKIFKFVFSLVLLLIIVTLFSVTQYALANRPNKTTPVTIDDLRVAFDARIQEIEDSLTDVQNKFITYTTTPEEPEEYVWAWQTRPTPDNSGSSGTIASSDLPKITSNSNTGTAPTNDSGSSSYTPSTLSVSAPSSSTSSDIDIEALVEVLASVVAQTPIAEVEIPSDDEGNAIVVINSEPTENAVFEEPEDTSSSSSGGGGSNSSNTTDTTTTDPTDTGSTDDPTDPVDTQDPPQPGGQLVFIDPPVPSFFTWDPADVFANPPTFPADVMERLEPAPIPDVEQLIPIACEVNEQNFDPAMFNDPSCQFFHVLPGNYDIDGDRIPLTVSGTPTEPRVIFAAQERPWDLPASQRATFAGFEIEADHIYFINLEFYGNNSTHNSGANYNGSTRQLDGNYNVWHGNLVRNSSSLCRCYGDYNTMQFNLADDRPQVPFDVGGFAFYSKTGEESRGNRILYNEIIGYSDGVGLPRDGSSSIGSAPATIVAYNYSWVPESLYQYNEVVDEVTGETQIQVTACAEDGFDFKNGSLGMAEADRSYFLYNISRGHRVTNQSCGGSGSAGNSWIFHNWTRNWDAAGNLSFNDAAGLHLKNISDVHNVERVYMYKNVWAHMPSSNAGGLNGERENGNDGLALRAICEQNCKIYDNLIYNVQTDSLWDEASNNTPITNNTLVDVVNRNLTNQNVLANPPVINVQIAESPLKNPGATITIPLTTVN